MSKEINIFNCERDSMDPFSICRLLAAENKKNCEY